MNYIGVDLHKRTISICVVRLEGQKRVVVARKRLECSNTEGICRFFRQYCPFQVVVEATASYEWFLALVEPLTDEKAGGKVVLAHPGKLRVIAESAYKTDKIDARVLAELLAVDMIPTAYRPGPRQREHRTLVRHRYYIQRRSTSVRNRIRNILSNYNADCKDLFTRAGLEYLAKVPVLAADRFALDQLVAEWKEHQKRLYAADKQLAEFAANKELSEAEKNGRETLATIPTVGAVTIDIVLAEVGVKKNRFKSLKRAGSFIGLAPGVRESAGKTKEQGITKRGPRLLRWAMIQTSWRLVRCDVYGHATFERLAHRRGKKKAIAAVGRRVFCMMIAMLRSGEAYRSPKLSAELEDGFSKG